MVVIVNRWIWGVTHHEATLVYADEDTITCVSSKGHAVLQIPTF